MKDTDIIIPERRGYTLYTRVVHGGFPQTFLCAQRCMHRLRLHSNGFLKPCSRSSS